MRKICELGRSMVEMLGVLAIIGVLSVGGIAGYSKAMMKHKLNKHAQSFNELLNNSIQITYKLKNAGTKDENNNTSLERYVDLFDKLQLIPDGMKYVNSGNIHDIFNSYIGIYRYTALNWAGMYITINDKNHNNIICKNFASVTKEFYHDIRQIGMQQSDNNGGATNIGTLHGNRDCKNNVKCLKNMTISDIENLCDTCEGSCVLYISWYVD